MPCVTVFVLFPRKCKLKKKQTIYIAVSVSPSTSWIYIPQKLIWLFDGNCLFSVDSLLVKKIEIRLNFDGEKLRACSTSRSLRASNFTSASKDEPRISATYFPAREKKHNILKVTQTIWNWDFRSSVILPCFKYSNT